MESTNRINIDFSPSQYLIVSKHAMRLYNDLLAHQVSEQGIGILCEVPDGSALRLFPRNPENSSAILKNALNELVSNEVFFTKGAGLFMYYPLRFTLIEKVI